MTDLEEDKLQMQEFLRLQTTEVQEDCTIVSTADVAQDFMLRIDKYAPDVFYPNMPKSAAPTENTSTPRITCAPDLIGCMIGYFRIERDVQDGTYDKDVVHDRPKFTGGYQISKLPFTHCLKPGSKMVIDSKSSDEHWIVPYSTDSVEVDPLLVGQMFIDTVTYLPRAGHWPGVRLNVFLRINEEMTLRLKPGTFVGKGFWKFTVEWENIRLRSLQEDCLKDCVAVTEQEYLSNKSLRADALSYSEKTPVFLSW